MTYALIPLGAVQSGFISSAVNAQFAVALGGALVVFFALVMGLSTRRIRTIGMPQVAEGEERQTDGAVTAAQARQSR